MVHLACSRVAHGLHSPYRDCLSTQSSGSHGTCMRARFATASNAAHATSGHTHRIRHECTGTAACRRWQARVRTIWRRVRSPSGVCCRLQRSCPATARPDASAVAPLHFQLPGRPALLHCSTACRLALRWALSAAKDGVDVRSRCVAIADGPDDARVTLFALRSFPSDTRIRIQNTDTEYGAAPKIRNTDTEYRYGIRICSQNTDTETEYEYGIRICAQNIDTDTEYGYGIRICAQNTDVGYGIQIRNAELHPKYGCEIRNTDTEYRYGMRSCAQNTDADTECRCSLQKRTHNTDAYHSIQIKPKIRKHPIRIVSRSHHSCLGHGLELTTRTRELDSRGQREDPGRGPL